MATTYELIATTTLTSNQTSVTFSGITGSYTDLVCVVSGKNSTSSARIDVMFNGDTLTNYSYLRLQGDGATPTSNKNGTITYMIIGTLTTTQNTVIAQINNYANSTTYKTVVSRWNTADSTVGAAIGLWRSTSAITEIRFGVGSDTLASGTVISIYGIQAA